MDLWLGFLAAADGAPSPGGEAGAAARAARDANLRSLLLADPDSAKAEALVGRDALQTLVQVQTRQPGVLLP